MFESTTCKVEKYADDSTLTTNGSTAQVTSDKLTFNCDKINNWMAQNRMVLNADTHVNMPN